MGGCADRGCHTRRLIDALWDFRLESFHKLSNAAPSVWHSWRPRDPAAAVFAWHRKHMPLSRNTAFGVGAWKPSDGFFNLDERLAKIRVAAGLTLPLAPPNFHGRPPCDQPHGVWAVCVHRGVYSRALSRDVPWRVHARWQRILPLSRQRIQRGHVVLARCCTWLQSCRSRSSAVVHFAARGGGKRSGFSIETHNNILSPSTLDQRPMLVPGDQCHGTSEYQVQNRKVSDVTKEGRAQLGRVALANWSIHGRWRTSLVKAHYLAVASRCRGR